MVHPLEQADVLGACGQEVAVVLHPDEDAARGGILRAFAEIGRDPSFDHVPGGPAGDGLPLLRRDVGVREDAQHGGAQLHADVHPILDPLLTLGT